MTDALLIYQHTLLVGAALFAIGLFGFLVRRNLIVAFLCVEMMLQGVSLTWVAAGAFYQQWSGQVMVVLIIAVAACEAGVGLAMVMMLYQRRGSLDTLTWQDLREPGRPAHVDHEIPEDEFADEATWPSLTPAGAAPEPQEAYHRSHV